MTRVLVAVLGIAAIAALGYWQFTQPSPNPMDETAPSVLAQGRRIYEQQCASCHGANLEGQPNWRSRLPDGRMPAPPHDASGHTWHHPSAVLFDIVEGGIEKHAPPGYRSDMPAFGEVLSDPEIWAVLAYIKSTWPAEVRARHDALDRRGTGG